MKIYVLNPLTPSQIKELLQRALKDPVKGLGSAGVMLDDQVIDEIVARSKGDARTALNILETAWEVRGDKAALQIQDIQETAGHFYVNYDKKADRHYDTISAFIKSIRGSDPDAALFWLAVMIQGGEDPIFIARRLVVHAAEDIGLADPQALLIAVAAFQATQMIGLPEARIPLAEATIYLASSPKSNSSKAAIDLALDYVRHLPSIEVPGHIADNSHSRSHLLGKGGNYKFPHAFGGYVDQEYLPTSLGRPVFYTATENGQEADRKRFMEWIQEAVSQKRHHHNKVNSTLELPPES